MERREQNECGFIHRLVSGSVRCGALREHHSQYTGHEFTEPERQPVTRFRISTHDNGYYCVSIPNYEGGEVVVASEHDHEHTALVAQRDLLVVALRDARNSVDGDVDYFDLRDRIDNALATVEQGGGEL